MIAKFTRFIVLAAIQLMNHSVLKVCWCERDLTRVNVSDISYHPCTDVFHVKWFSSVYTQTPNRRGSGIFQRSEDVR